MRQATQTILRVPRWANTSRAARCCTQRALHSEARGAGHPQPTYTAPPRVSWRRASRLRYSIEKCNGVASSERRYLELRLSGAAQVS